MRQTRNEGGLYRPEYEHDACGVGFVADITGYASHDILQKAVEALANLTHRGARDADAKTGDGAGVLTQIPQGLFAREMQRSDGPECGPGDLAVGMIFLPRDDATANDRCRIIIEEAVDHHDLVFMGWRQVPVDSSVLGDTASEQQPDIWQVLVGRPHDLSQTDFSRTLYLVRRQIERSIRRHGISDCYVCSLSNRTIVYKGMMVAPQLCRFYRDLQDPRYETALAVFHQRYSTNTVPNWILAQPFRYLAHNGEINTLRGNTAWMRGREPSLSLDAWGSRISRIRPIIDPAGSDSAQLDNVTEALCVAGRDPMHALMMLLPEAHQNIPDVSPDLRGFYEFHDGLCEPWDGPAAIAFSDGDYVGAILDRNGLRPARYKLTDDDVIIMGSEVGMLDVPDSRVIEKGRLGPGQMVVVDTRTGVLLRNDDSKALVARQRPYIQWVREHMVRLDRARASDQPVPSIGQDRAALQQRQVAFGYSADELDYVLVPMANDGKEPVGSMGNDTPLAVLSRRPQLLYNYFSQRFAQVTNPPIDPMRETLVTCLDVHIGRRGNLFDLNERHARLMRLRSPMLLDSELAHLKETGSPDLRAEVLPATADPREGARGLQHALEALCERASRAIDSGKTILILSDRDISPSEAPFPMLLTVGAVHHHLLREGKRTLASLVVESGEPREVHHFACLIGYGACAVNPYLAYETLADLVEKGRLESGLGYHQALENYRKAVEVGILKILAKMGISNLSSYHGAQLFDAVGLHEEVVERCFSGTSSQVGGIGIDEIADAAIRSHQQAFEHGTDCTPAEEGIYRYRRDGEYHAYNPSVFKAIHKVAETGTLADFKSYSELVDSRPPTALRDLMVVRGRRPILVDEVEPVEAICRRFATSAMSHGALSKEAHETLAIAMNRIGGKSNSGEGGEDPARYRRRENGDWANSAIKQVASGRFGVTPGYLASARELEIKIAQGSKPGEGGQLPGHKVSAEIARIRHSVPGVTLISPPPHHDIYSIEDLAQLIYDLKQINSRAKVCVKLVSLAGVGTIAAGVAKGYADVIHISGHDGGTGASPLGAIKHSGTPWELGLSEAQQTLVRNDLRGRVVLRVDGGLKTGRDVLIAAILGAEEYGFGTSAVVAEGCVMARQCHLNTCPVGVATQKPELRARFKGTPEKVVNLFTALAQEVRELLAGLGYRCLDEIIGRTELLEPRTDLSDPGCRAIDLAPILHDPDPQGSRPRRHMRERNDRPDDHLDDLILHEAKDAIAENASIVLNYEIGNTRRAVGAKLAGEIAYHYGDQGLDGTVECRFRGSAGQSFGAFCIRGLKLVLTGEANDYVGKSMHGGEIIIAPPDDAAFQTHQNVIIGNTCLYGATGGTLHAAGRAGERFCVRNSGGRAVVEGVGDHGCEYMTGGVVVVLGTAGRNFGAGMTGGLAYVLDEEGSFEKRYNPQLVQVERLEAQDDVDELRGMVAAHLEDTASKRAGEILARWNHYLPLFWKVAPRPPEEEDELIIPERYQEVHHAGYRRRVLDYPRRQQETPAGP